MSRKIKMGMVGGGPGAFSSDPKRSNTTGRALHLPEERIYGSYGELFAKEKARPEDQRMDFVSIVTPNHLHFPVAQAALGAGFHVVCEKPMTVNTQEAKQLASLVEDTGLLFALTHNYTGYPMIKQARHMIQQGELGEIRKIVVEYPQGWLATKLEEEGNKQADWRTDPEKAGSAGAMGDIGTHAENLAEYVSGLQVTELCADLSTFVEGRPLDDDGNVLLRFENGAKGILHASQISVGEENALKIYVYGEKGGLEWHQQSPNTLWVKYPHGDRPAEVYRTGADHEYLCEPALKNTRLPAGHPEGFIEAFGNIYRNFTQVVQRRLKGEKPPPEEMDFPTVGDGVRGMAFIETLMASDQSNEKWTKFTS